MTCRAPRDAADTCSGGGGFGNAPGIAAFVSLAGNLAFLTIQLTGICIGASQAGTKIARDAVG
jgi:hypothetical protein